MSRALIPYNKNKQIVKKTVTTTRTKRTRKNRNNRILGPFVRGIGFDPFRVKDRVKFTYMQTSTLSVGASGLLGTMQEFNLNNLYDCDRTGQGHQPYGYDEMSALYNSYFVHTVDLDIFFRDPNIDSMYMVCRIIAPNTTSSLSSANNTFAAETPWSLQRYLSDTGNQEKRIKARIPLYKLLGITKAQFSAGCVTGLYSAAFPSGYPSNQPVLQIAVADARGFSTGSCLCTVKLTYHTQIYGRKILPTS